MLRTLFLSLILVTAEADPDVDPPRPAVLDSVPEHIWQQMLPAYIQGREDKARRLGYRIEPGRCYSELYIPRPMTTGQLRRYASILRLSDAQFLVFEAFHQQYLSDDGLFVSARFSH